MNTVLRKQSNNEFDKNVFKLMINSVFGKTIENFRKHRDIKLVTSEKKKLKLVSEPNYHATKYFSENLIAIEMKKSQVKMNKPIHLGIPILDMSKTLMYEFQYDYLKPKYNDNVKLCYINTGSFVTHIKTGDFFSYINNDVETWFDTSNYYEKDNRSLPIGKNEKNAWFI